MIRVGVVYPQTEFGNDPAAIRDYAQTAEALGYNHVLAYDHVVGANPDRPGGWSGPYTHEHAFHEPFGLFSFMAAVTSTLEFTTGILILPQRQTALVAKQASTLDVLSGGRVRLGVAVGWNSVEYDVLGEDFHTRGRRIEEQIKLLRRLWTEPLVTFDGQWDKVPDAGLNPLPIQRPIPIWFGGHADIVLRRLGKMGDGWFPNYRTPEAARPHLARLADYTRQAGRDASEVGIEARVTYGQGDPGEWHRQLEAWSSEGATHLTVNTMGLGFEGPAPHLAAIRRFAEESLSGRS